MNKQHNIIQIDTSFTKQVGIELPIIGGAMYPCSNCELVAAISEAGGIGIIQPISLTYVHGYDFREGIKYIKKLTSKPIGMNALIEKSSQKYHEKMQEWIDIALEEGIRFFVTSLGKPGWVVNQVRPAGGIVYHDVTERKWAEKGLEGQVDGLIAVNNRAGGHAGNKVIGELYNELKDFDKPVICAGGIGDESSFVDALNLGYAGVQMGTRFIATEECSASEKYKTAIITATENDIVMNERITGVPVSIINTAKLQASSLKSGYIARQMLKGNSTKSIMRMIYALKSLYQLKRALHNDSNESKYWQAGKSVAGITKVETVDAIIKRFSQIWLQR